MIRLSVNINKVATLRNARGGNNPDVIQVAQDCEQYGAQGITVHPRPDGRHIRMDDVFALKEVVKTELNIEGFPDKRFIELIGKVQPHQVTLVPDPPSVLTSNTGWDTVKEVAFLEDVIQQFKQTGCRTSIFVNPTVKMVEGAARVGADRIELYTEPYAAQFPVNKTEALKPYLEAAREAQKLGLGINAGHDLDLKNLNMLARAIPFMEEVSIGHALICDALYLGLEQTIKLYRQQLIIG